MQRRQNKTDRSEHTSSSEYHRASGAEAICQLSSLQISSHGRLIHQVREVKLDARFLFRDPKGRTVTFKECDESSKILQCPYKSQDWHRL